MNFKEMVEMWFKYPEKLRLILKKRKLATQFNELYAYSEKYWDKPHMLMGFHELRVNFPYAWMCPDCNKIHKPVKVVGIIGMIYPECCSYPEGSRADF